MKKFLCASLLFNLLGANAAFAQDPWAWGGGTVSAINDITDVTITSADEESCLQYNGTAWVNSNCERQLSSFSGIDPTGATSSHAEFVTAITWCSDNQATLRVGPSETYLIDHMIHWPENCHLIGSEGKNFSGSQLSFQGAGIIFDGTVVGSDSLTFFSLIENVTLNQTPSTTATTVSGDEVAGQTVISVLDRTGFAAYDTIEIELDDASTYQTRIVSSYVAATGAGDITIEDAIPTSRTLQAICTGCFARHVPDAFIEFQNQYSNTIRNVRMHEIDSQETIEYNGGNDTLLEEIVIYGEDPDNDQSSKRAIDMNGGFLTIRGIDIELAFDDGIYYLDGNLDLYNPHIERVTTGIYIRSDGLSLDNKNGFNVYGGEILVNASGNGIELDRCTNVNFFGTLIDDTSNADQNIVVIGTSQRQYKNCNFWGMDPNYNSNTFNRNNWYNFNGSTRTWHDDLDVSEGLREITQMNSKNISDNTLTKMFEISSSDASVDGVLELTIWGRDTSGSDHVTHRSKRVCYWYEQTPEVLDTCTTIYEVENATTAGVCDMNMQVTISIVSNDIEMRVQPDLTGTGCNGGAIDVYGHLQILEESYGVSIFD